MLKFCLLPNKLVLHKNDLFGQTRVSSVILMPNPFFSRENTRPNGENTRSRGLTISHHGIFFQEPHFSARMAKILVFLSNVRNKYHMEDPGIHIHIHIHMHMHIYICLSTYIYIYNTIQYVCMCACARMFTYVSITCGIVI